MKKLFSSIIATLTIGAFSMAAAEVPADVKPLIEKQMASLNGLSTDATIVAAVKKYNAAPPSAMTNDAWKKLTVISPEVKALIKSDIGLYLKSKQAACITEMFLSGADGGKVAFLAKTSSWSHKGKPKHDVPMTGKTWTGDIEVDESTGAQQVQVAIPVLDGDKPVGSLVVGLGIAQMKETAK